MKIFPTSLPGVYVLEPRLFKDERGYFVETFNKKIFEMLGIEGDFIQDNQSLSIAEGTIRGLHFQTNPEAQTKIVRCVSGSIYDVAVDIRKSSPTYGQWVGVELSAENGHQLVVPIGFAHGFCTLEPNTIVSYKVDNYYSPEHDDGIAFDDPDLGVKWPTNHPILSEKDKNLPRLKDSTHNFIYGGNVDE